MIFSWSSPLWMAIPQAHCRFRCSQRLCLFSPELCTCFPLAESSLYLSFSGEVNTDANLLCISRVTNIRSNEYRAIDYARASISTLSWWHQTSKVQESWHHSYICILASCGLFCQLVLLECVYPYFYSYCRWNVTPSGLKQYRYDSLQPYMQFWVLHYKPRT